jgi:basic membrane protein A and related proteins
MDMKFRSLTLVATTALVSALGTAAVIAADAKPAALIIAQGGLGDQSYNDLAFEGFKRALKATGIDG